MTTTPAPVASPSTVQSTQTTVGGPVMSAAARAYLEEAIGQMAVLSINKDRVDWERVRELALLFADGAEIPADTYRAIEVALGELHDQHSVFMTAAEAERFREGRARFDTPLVQRRSDRLGYVMIGSYIGDVGDNADAYARDLAARIATVSEVCGWIVDLRANPGGNMWPMLAGLSPIIGQGTVGGFTYPDGLFEPWTIDSGTAYWDAAPMTVSGDGSSQAYELPVAVLIGSGTASSGEATAIALHGRPHTRFFGQPTAGLTTSNEPVLLSDGAVIFLTMSVFTDRNLNQWGQGLSIEPDQRVGTGARAEGNEPVSQAAEWVHNQPSCTS